MTDQRLRTYTWADPAALADAARTMSGLEFLDAIADGLLPAPPIMQTVGIAGLTVQDGRVVFDLEPQEWHYNPIGTVHGGILSTLADSAMACAVHTKLPAGTGYTSLELKINFTRAATLDSGVLRCEGTVLTLGRRAATAEAKITDAAGRLVAHATTTCLIIGPA